MKRMFFVLFRLQGITFLLLTACVATRSPGESQAASQDKPVLQANTATPVPISANPPDTCLITQPPDVPFTPPTPYPAKPLPEYGDEFWWYGTPELWTMLRTGGTWDSLPHNNDGYTQKIAWWREGYDMYAEPTPKLTVTGKRLDAPAPPLLASRATNASAELGEMMMIGVDIPTLGCWEITGQYNGHELSFVVWVAP